MKNIGIGTVVGIFYVLGFLPETQRCGPISMCYVFSGGDEPMRELILTLVDCMATAKSSMSRVVKVDDFSDILASRLEEVSE